jgi:hypothetical protein
MRAPRRSFATPFVITLAACTPMRTSNPPPPRNPPVTENPPTTDHRDTRHWKIAKANGTCTAGVECPSTTLPCNPPTPQPYDCPAELADGGSLEIVQLPGQTDCLIQHPPVQCPPNVMCNPPPPEKIACPK